MKNNVNSNEVLIEHIFNASPEKVFSAWTDPEKLVKWYAPDGCTVHFKKVNAETGGQFHSCISNPQYGDCWAVGEYKEVSPYRKTKMQLRQTVSQELAQKTGAYPSWLQMLNKMQAVFN
jgi:uncharacterized protein YndB with AHSA1/START domain